MHGVTLRHSVIAVVAIFGNCDILNLEAYLEISCLPRSC